MIHVSVKELNAVSAKINAYVGERVATQLATIEGTAICAGIRDNSELQKRARINHYGGSGNRTFFVKRWEESTTASGQKRFRYRKVKMTVPYRLPERHFIDYAVSNGMLGGTNKKLADYISKALQGRARISTYNGTLQTTKQRESLFSEGIGITKFYGTLGETMVENQKNALVNTEPNAPSTVARKGENTPMRETYELYNNIEWWTESV